MEIKNSALFSLDFDNNTILSCFVFYFKIIDLYILIPAAIAQIFNPIAALVISIRMPSKEVKTEIELHPVIIETKIRKRSI